MSLEHKGDEDERVPLDPEERRINEVATEVSALFKRVLDGMRTFPAGHITLRGYFQQLFDGLQAQLQAETEYSLKVTPLGFATDTTLISPAKVLADSFTHPLYLDGITLLAVEQGLTFDEMSAMMQIWRDTLDNKLAETHTFATKFWESDFHFISVVSVETFTEGGAVDPVTKKKRESPLQQVMEELQTGAQASGVGGGEGGAGQGAGKGKLGGGGTKKLSRVAKEDVRQLKLQGVPDLSDDDLKRYEASERMAIPGLDPKESTSLLKEFDLRHNQQVERSFDALFVIGTRATADELDRLAQAFKLVLGAMLANRQLDRLQQNLMRLVSAIRSGDATQMEARFKVLTGLMQALKANNVIEPIVAALDAPEKAQAAMNILKFIPGKPALTLLDWLVVPETPTGLRTLSDLIAAGKPDPQELAARVSWAHEDLVLELLHIGQAMGPEASWPVRKAALQHPSPVAQKAAVTALPKELLVAHKTELLPLLFSNNADFRHAVFGPFVGSHDKAVAPALATLLRRVQLDKEEHRRVLVALGQLGGPEACGALRHEFTNCKDVELRCVAAHSLAIAGDEKARPLLQEAAGKLFGGGELKAAAKEALSRLDHLQKKKP